AGQRRHPFLHRLHPGAAVKKMLIAFLVSGCSALPVGETDESLTGTISRIAQPPQLITISVDSIEPALPIEQRPVYLHFTLNNSTKVGRLGSVRAVVTRADGSTAASNSWRVSLGAYAS